MLVGLDIGTTNCKAGLFSEQGDVLRVFKLPTNSFRTSSGNVYYKPDVLWGTVLKILRSTIEDIDIKKINSIGISSMAEAGLLIDKNSGKAKSNIIPWFDKRTMPQHEIIKNDIDEKEMFKKTGLYPSYKYGLNKIMWLKERDPDILNQAKWLSVADFIAFKLTGNIGTDYSLAARTYLFRVDKKEWNIKWIDNFGLTKDNFPEVYQSGTVIGNTSSESGIEAGIPVAVAGHDHVCAALAVGAFEPGIVFDSMGTAETLVGAMPECTLGEEEYKSGLSYGCHVVKDRYFWLGGLSDSGGSLEWLRKIVGEDSLTYNKILNLLSDIDKKPGDILYYPYLSGSGAPLPDANTRGAFIGLKSNHGKAHLIKAILEGTAYEMESIRRSAVSVLNEDIAKITAVGGGINNPYWMNIKANVSGIEFDVLSLSEATLLGSALVAAIGSGFYKDADQAYSSINIKVKERFSPDKEQYTSYRDIYENTYMKFQSPLRDFYNKKSR